MTVSGPEGRQRGIELSSTRQTKGPDRSKAYNVVTGALKVLQNEEPEESSLQRKLPVRLLKIDVSLDEMKAMPLDDLESLEDALFETISVLQKPNPGEDRIDQLSKLNGLLRAVETLRSSRSQKNETIGAVAEEAFSELGKVFQNQTASSSPARLDTPPSSRSASPSSGLPPSPAPSRLDTPPLTKAVQEQNKKFNQKISQVNVLARYILEKGLWKTEGPFRVPGTKKNMDSLEKELQKVRSDKECLKKIQAFGGTEADLLGVLKHLSTDVMWHAPEFSSSTTRRDLLNEKAPALKELIDCITKDADTTKMSAENIDIAFPQVDPADRFAGLFTTVVKKNK